MKTWRWIYVLLTFAIFTVNCDPNPNSIQLETNQGKRSYDKKLSDAPEIIKPHRPLAPPLKPFMPTQLIIPSIHVFSKIKPVGVLANGQMDVPQSTDLVGILHPGVLAGAKGNLIMDGHVDSYTGPAVLFDLKKLKPRDIIIVRDNLDRQLTYRVESVESFITSEAPIERIFGETDEIRLNLITCTGTYSRKKKEHQKRLIVFAKLDGER
ncbi:class F sortase [Paenibacillus glacialis]|uniref:Class F sortase n=1 Tax=Paenibacillus glacialis TaxID=494026 RepID=A0A162Q2Q6_9BACL|nr:class F sortase [Paenibacillus glacialis]OAB41660.1 hypothetical protein PGLA_15380 [Paenibacillus glacialis]